MSRALVLLALAVGDGGVPARKAPALSPADAEVVRELELLQALDEATELDVLEELSLER